MVVLDLQFIYLLPDQGCWFDCNIDYTSEVGTQEGDASSQPSLFIAEVPHLMLASQMVSPFKVFIDSFYAATASSSSKAAKDRWY